jgi:hypothetical protein
MILAIFRWNLGAIGHKEFCTVIADQCAAVLNRACSDPEARGHLADLIGIEERTIADWVQPEPLQRALLHAKPIRDLPRQLKELGLHGRRRRRR